MSGTCVVAAGQAFQLANLGAFRSTAHVFVDYARRLSPAFAKISSLDRLQVLAQGGEIETAKDQHQAVCTFLECLKQASSQEPTGPDTYLFIAKCSEYDRYIDKLASEHRANSRAEWEHDGTKSNNNAILAQAIGEIVGHMQGFAGPAQPYEGFKAYAQAKINALLPAAIAGMRQETNMALVLPMFEKSLSIPGDVAEFGCFRGALSIKLAWLMKAAGAQKHYYAFDTFHGFEIDDPAGLGNPGSGRLGTGSFQDNDDSYNILTKWSRILPLTPIKGDATKTCSILTKPLSFVWLDLDMDILLDPVLRQIWHLCSSETIIGIDDTGRPENPTVGPWVEQLIATGAVDSVFDSEDIAPGLFIRFLRKQGELPANIVGAWRSAQKQ
jgi:hypothetical protein